MTKTSTRHAGTAGARRRRHRSRPVPKWLIRSTEVDTLARSRCLMVLSVLSGEKPVTEAIQEAKIARGTYYQMEDRALKAMLAALNPLATDQESADRSMASGRIVELQARVKRLEQEKRRVERLLLLTRKLTPMRVVTGRRGRPPGRLNSILNGRTPSRRLKGKATPPASSTPTEETR